jgi:hypothetical protein
MRLKSAQIWEQTSKTCLIIYPGIPKVDQPEEIVRLLRSELPHRVCTKCGLEKPQEEFPFKNTLRNIRHAVCKDCTAQRSSQRYYSDPQLHIQKVNQSRGNYLDNNAQYVLDYLNQHPCVDCGESNPVLLEFDHRPGVHKVERVSQMVAGGYSLERIISEIEKCDVRCANCHRRKTAEERGWFRYFLPTRQAKNNREAQRERAKKFVHDYLSTHPCVDCGESNPVILEFDHLGSKTTSVAKMAADGFGLETIQREIEKCKVRCVNCHRKITVEERGWYRGRK